MIVVVALGAGAQGTWLSRRVVERTGRLFVGKAWKLVPCRVNKPLEACLEDTHSVS